jgi:hypothetical protein
MHTMKLPSFSHQVWLHLFSPSYIISIDTDTRVIWGVNLGQRNLTAAFLEVQAIVNAFASPAIKDSGIVLEAIEVGNEADFYKKNHMRPKTFTSTEYVREYVSPTSLSARRILTHIPLC